jgi:hypothetical protein
MPTLRPAALFAALLLAAPALADRITTTDGKTLDDVEITNETLGGVLYKQKGKAGEQNVAADQVLSVVYTSKVPGLIATAHSDLEDGNLEAAADGFKEFAESVFAGSNKKDKQAWAPGYALYRAIETNMAMSSQESITEVIALADMLVAKAPESRYVPLAYVAKASAQRDLKKGDDAMATVNALKELVKSKALSDAFRLQAELLEVELGAGKAQARRDRYIEIGTQAGSGFPAVRNRARVLEAETHIEGESKDFAKARKLYDQVIKDPKADGATLAGAYTGMGDCLFQEAVDKLRVNADASAILEEALLSYLRVVVNYKDQTRYVPRALYQSGKVFEFMGDAAKPNSTKMYRKLVTEYPGSEWAAKARDSRR